MGVMPLRALKSCPFKYQKVKKIKTNPNAIIEEHLDPHNIVQIQKKIDWMYNVWAWDITLGAYHTNRLTQVLPQGEVSISITFNKIRTHWHTKMAKFRTHFWHAKKAEKDTLSSGTSQHSFALNTLFPPPGLCHVSIKWNPAIAWILKLNFGKSNMAIISPNYPALHYFFALHKTKNLKK